MTNEQILAEIAKIDQAISQTVTTGGISDVSFGDRRVGYNQPNISEMRIYRDYLLGLLNPQDPAHQANRRAPIGFWF